MLKVKEIVKYNQKWNMGTAYSEFEITFACGIHLEGEYTVYKEGDCVATVYSNRFKRLHRLERYIEQIII